MAYIDDPYKRQQENQNQNQSTGGNLYATSNGNVGSSEGGTSFNSQNQNQSQGSGNWVNLDSYLDANRNKSANYANSLVQNKLSTQDEYKTGLNTALNNYTGAIKKDTAYNTGSGTSKALIDKGAKNLDNLSEEETSILANTLKGYQGPGTLESNSNEYGLFDLRNQSEGYNKFAEGLMDEDYRKSLMRPNMSSGSKKLNSFLLGSKEAQNEFQNSSEVFKQLANLYGDTLNEADLTYEDVVNQANANRDLANQNFDRSYADLEKYLDDQYAKQLAIANKDRSKVGTMSGQTGTSKTNNFGSRLNLNVAGQYGWNPDTKEAQSILQTEKDELMDRINYLRGLANSSEIKPAPTSSLDDKFGMNFLTNNYSRGNKAVGDVSDVLATIRFNLPDEIKEEGYSLMSTNPQEYARRTFDEVVAKDPVVKKIAQKYVDDYIRGKNPDVNKLKKDIRDRIVLNYDPTWYESVLAPIDRLSRGKILESLEAFNDVATAPAKWGYNAGKKVVSEVGKGIKNAGRAIGDFLGL